MAGNIKGVAARIQRCYPRAIYVHCGSHLLKLAVASSCTVHEICSMLEHVREVTQIFISHPKHFDLLCSKITFLLPAVRHSRLVDFCRTRWVTRLDALDVFIDAFRAIVAALEHVKKIVDSTWAPDVINAAYNHFNGVFSREEERNCNSTQRNMTRQNEGNTSILESRSAVHNNNNSSQIIMYG